MTPELAALVEKVARAMAAQSRPDADPDRLTPLPRGAVGLMPVWRLFEPMALAAIRCIAEATREASEGMLDVAEWSDGGAQGEWRAMHAASVLGEALRHGE